MMDCSLCMLASRAALSASRPVATCSRIMRRSRSLVGSFAFSILVAALRKSLASPDYIHKGYNLLQRVGAPVFTILGPSDDAGYANLGEKRS